MTGTVALLRARLVAGWRHAQGAGPWPELPAPPPATDMGGQCSSGVWVPPPAPAPPTPLSVVLSSEAGLSLTVRQLSLRQAFFSSSQ